MPLKISAHPLHSNGAQWQTIPTERGAQTPRNALKQFMKNQGAQWSRGCTVLPSVHNQFVTPNFKN
jgi:hypothetical protein